MSTTSRLLRRLFMCFFIRRGSRQVFLAGMTTNPTWAWVTQCHEVSVPAQRDRQLGEEVPEAPAGKQPCDGER